MFYFLVLICGILFGSGMAFSGMTDTTKVIGFLDIAGNWDPTLMFVMGGGLLLTVPFFQLGLSKLKKPVFGENFRVPLTQIIDTKLISGAIMFGIGWGLYGYCPGPAISSLAYGNAESFLFLGAMLFGMISADLIMKAIKTRHIAFILGRE